MIYVVTEWDGKGSGSRTLITKSKKEAMAARRCTLSRGAAKKKYGDDYFYAEDVPATYIDVFPTKKALSTCCAKRTQIWY